MSAKYYSVLFTAMYLFLTQTGSSFAMKENESTQSPELIRIAVRQLVKMQDASGLWPYDCFDGAHSVYGIANTAIVVETLLLAAPEDESAQAAVQQGLSFVLAHLDDAEMSETADPLRVWGHVFALELLCQVHTRKRAGKREKEVEKWIPRLVQALAKEQRSDGGWGYSLYLRFLSSSFVTAVVAQALLQARAQGEPVSDDLLASCRKRLAADRLENGAFTYEGDADKADFKPLRKRRLDSLPGSAGRSSLGENTLVLLGGGSVNAVRLALDNFHQHWVELEEHSKRGSTHAGPYEIAPYFFYFGHRYAAQAIQLLPEKERPKERERLLKLILKTRDADGTWNDRIFSCDSSYGTAMVVLCLLGDQAPLPPRIITGSSPKNVGEK